MNYSFRIEQALRAASILHKNQVRKGSTPLPYVTHPFAVAMIASDYTDKEDIIVAALLHDTLEDTDYTEAELEEDFGGTVLDLVRAVTEPGEEETEVRSWFSSRRQTLVRLKNGPKDALIIAAADKIHNMRCAVDEYYEKHTEFLADFGGSLDERLITYQEFSNFLNRSLDNSILSEFNHVFDEYKKFLEAVERTRVSA
jgi:(p)ppGpp synthase/HD superfamily hydrolase